LVRVFNHWFSPRKAAYFLAEESVLVLALLAGASLGPVAAKAGGDAVPVAPAVLRAALASLFFAGALYLGDLYDLHAAVRDRADGRRLLRAIGIAAIAIALADVALDVFLPGWMLHRSLVLAAAGGAFGVVAARALLPAVVGAPTRVLFLGAGPRARDLARAVEREADGLWEVAGFVCPPHAKAQLAVPPGTLREGPIEEVARAVRAQVISLRNRDHVNLSKLSGHSIVHIILTDILPYIASYVIMALILQISSAILAEAGLSILGLGPKTTEVPTLGLMMQWAMIYQAQVQGKWWAYFPVIVTIALITFSMNLMNTGLDQLFNPALRE
jgi:hypothetical protein